MGAYSAASWRVTTRGRLSRIGRRLTRPVVQWCQEQAGEYITSRHLAAEWLRGLLADGPLPAKDVTRKAREVGIADRTLRRAKRAVGVVSEATRDENKAVSAWTWSLATLGNSVGPLGPLAAESKAAHAAQEAYTVNGSDGDAGLPMVNATRSADSATRLQARGGPSM